MTIKVGDRVPDGKLLESTDFDTATQCALPPKPLEVATALAGKKIVIFGLPGAYTPTCSAKGSTSSGPGGPTRGSTPGVRWRGLERAVPSGAGRC